MMMITYHSWLQFAAVAQDLRLLTCLTHQAKVGYRIGTAAQHFCLCKCMHVESSKTAKARKKTGGTEGIGSEACHGGASALTT